MFLRFRTKPLKAGDVIWQYQIDAKLGEGAFGEVYRAHHLTLQRKVALKRLRSGVEQMVIDKLVREAIAMAEINHPNIVVLFELIEPDKYPNVDTHYIVMECLDTTLRTWMEEQRLTTLADQVYVIQEVLRGLAVAHQQKIYHRDIKPENILLGLDKEGNKLEKAKIADWGLAHLENYSLTISDAIVGTLFYMSPEQARGKSGSVDGRSDLYSLGVILYEMVTNNQYLPFQEINRAAVSKYYKAHPEEGMIIAQRAGMDACLKAIYTEARIDPLEFGLGLSEQLRAVLLKSLQIEPGDRFQTADEFGAALTNLLQTAETSTKSTVIDERVSKVASLLVQARELGQQHSYAEAVALLQEACKSREGDAGVCLELAHIYNLMGQRREAVEVLEESCKWNPDNYVVLRDLGITYMGLREIDQALEIFQRSLKLNPNQPHIEKLIERLTCQ